MFLKKVTLCACTHESLAFLFIVKGIDNFSRHLGLQANSLLLENWISSQERRVTPCQAKSSGKTASCSFPIQESSTQDKSLGKAGHARHRKDFLPWQLSDLQQGILNPPESFDLRQNSPWVAPRRQCDPPLSCPGSNMGTLPILSCSFPTALHSAVIQSCSKQPDPPGSKNIIPALERDILEKDAEG